MLLAMYFYLILSWANFHFKPSQTVTSQRSQSQQSLPPHHQCKVLSWSGSSSWAGQAGNGLGAGLGSRLKPGTLTFGEAFLLQVRLHLAAFSTGMQFQDWVLRQSLVNLGVDNSSATMHPQAAAALRLFHGIWESHGVERT